MASINLKHTSGNGTILNSPAANPSADITLKLPSTTGSAGQFLKVASANHSSTNAELEFGALGSTGKILQVVSETKTDTASTNSTSFVTTGLEKAITITSGSKVLVLIDLFVGVIGGYSVAFQLYNGSSQVTAFQGDARGSAIRGFAGDFITPYRYGQVSVANHFLDTPSGTSQNYKVYWRNGYSNTGADVYLNRPEQNPNHEQAVAACSSLTLIEIGA